MNESAPGMQDAQQAAMALIELAYAERALAHVLLGHLPKVEDLALKLDLAEAQWDALRESALLKRRATGLARVHGPEPTVGSALRRAFITLDGAPNVGALLEGLGAALLPWLGERQQRYLRDADPLGDGPSIALVRQASERLDTLRAVVARHRGDTTGQGEPLARTLRDQLTAAVDGSAADHPPLERWLWQPLDRVPLAARPAQLERCLPGSLGLLTVDAVNEPRDVGIYLHSDLDEELTTLELVARNSYEHAQMPEAFHLDMSRQASDEARHARQILALMAPRGFAWGDFPINTGSYDGLYQFAPCAPGSEQELLWRMLIRQTFMEGLAIDSVAHDIERRRAAGQHDIARALSYILSDELFHAGSGQHWCKHLIRSDGEALLQARYEAVLHYTTGAEALRARFVAQNLERAMGELTLIEEGKRRRGVPQRPLNRSGRRQAGYSDDDILQVLSWGYARE